MGGNSLEWLHWIKFLSIWEFSAKKNDGPKDQIPIIEDGELKTVNEFDYYSADLNALKLGKTPYFSKISKIREIIFVSEGRPL